jgi:16S rRNA (guanine(966)-N(2))-methyltransferase RsmD
MRIIAGEFRSRRLKTLPGLSTRPTPDRLREALFNILAPEIEGVTFIDAYAGTGAVGIEALSRGAARAIFIERSKTAAEIIRENLRALNLTNRAEVLQGRVAQYLPQRRAGIIFLDPPYDDEKEYNVIGVATADLVIAQHSTRLKLPDYPNYKPTRQVKQGDNALSFLKLIADT